MHRSRFAWTVLSAVVMVALSGCFTFKRHGELPTANFVDVNRVIGTWYVQGAMTTLLDRTPTDAAFTFSRNRNGTLRVEYEFKPNGPDSPVKVYTGKVDIAEGGTNADWDIQFLWPFENDYRVIYVADDYSTMILGHPSRKYLYVMSRQRQIDYKTSEWLLDLAASRGFDTSFMKRVPQF